jgi:hypothetical protein
MFLCVSILRHPAFPTLRSGQVLLTAYCLLLTSSSFREKLYFFAMKSFVGFIFLLFILSCNDEPVKQPAKPRLRASDSSLVKKEPANPYVAVDVSPMDMSYLPVDYPKLSVRKPLPVARIIYSRPHKQGRKIFGALLKYGEPWRLGANEASEIEFFIPVTIQKKTISKGRYIIYAILHQDHWTIVLNSNLNSWGLDLNPTKDLFKFDVPVQVKNMSIEYFSMVFQPASGGADLVMAWDDVEVRLPIQYTEK